MKMLTKISKGQQITIPSEFRKKLDLKEGSRIEIIFNEKAKEIVISPIKGEDIEELFKKARKRKPKKNLTIEEMEVLAEDGIPR